MNFPTIGPHITFDAADIELQVAAYKLAPALIVQHWTLFALRSHERIEIQAVRIIGTCAVCGLRAPVSPCSECDRDTDAPCLVECAGVEICLECAA